MSSAPHSESATPLKTLPPSVLVVGLADALDLPSEVQYVQDAYWQARRKWTELQHAYLTVIEDMVAIHGAEQLPAAERTQTKKPVTESPAVGEGRT